MTKVKDNKWRLAEALALSLSLVMFPLFLLLLTVLTSPTMDKNELLFTHRKAKLLNQNASK